MDLLLAKGHAPMIIAERQQADALLAIGRDENAQTLVGWTTTAEHPLFTASPQDLAEDWQTLATCPRLLVVGLEAQDLALGYWHDLSGSIPRKQASPADIIRAGRILTGGDFSVHALIGQ
ncbi:MAG: hypothetical protein Alpg2KO_27180 [Alphaproteobacteria bacterium]